MSKETVARSAISAEREAEIEEIMKAAMAAARNKPNTPPDCGSGYGELMEAAGRSTVGEAVELITNPYAGTEEPSSVVIRQPVDEFMLRKPA